MKWHQEIQALRGSDHILCRFLRPKIDEFYKQNKIRINTFIERTREVDKFWIEHDKDGKMLFEGEGQNRVKKLLEGRTKEEYEKATLSMWNEEVAVSW